MRVAKSSSASSVQAPLTAADPGARPIVEFTNATTEWVVSLVLRVGADQLRELARGEWPDFFPELVQRQAADALTRLDGGLAAVGKKRRR